MLAARCGYIALRGSRDVLALALDGADRLHHVHPPHHHGARRQAAAPRLVGRHCRQSNFRRVVGVAKLALNLRKLCWCGWLDPRRKEKARPTSTSLEVSLAKLLRVIAKPEHCLAKTQGRPGCEGPGSARFTCL